MNLQLKNQSSSELSSLRNDDRILTQLHKLSIKALRSSESVLSQETIEHLQKKYTEIMEVEEMAVQFVEYFMFTLINEMDKLNHALTINVIKQDYEILESSVQKSQAQIRKHLRIQQQLKIYLDSLQQKVEQLQKKLLIEENKYVQIFQAMREIDEQKKLLIKKLYRYEKNEQFRSKNKTNSNYSTINEHGYEEYIGDIKTKGPKNKHILQKFNEKIKKQSLKIQKSKLVEGPIHINLSKNVVVNKKSSYDQNVHKSNNISNDSSIRCNNCIDTELTKTVQMKQKQQQNNHAIHPYDHRPRPNRKISKYKTQMNQGMMGKKEIRSNSVCN